MHDPRLINAWSASDRDAWLIPRRRQRTGRAAAQGLRGCCRRRPEAAPAAIRAKFGQL